MESEAATLLAQYNLKLDPAIPYNLESMFQKTSGWGVKGEVKRIHKAIVPIEPLLKRLLQNGEEVLYVARGVQFKFSEQYFLGIWANLINQTVFVLTNLRLLMFHVNSKGLPRYTYWLIYYNQITKFKASMLGNVSLNLQDGTKLSFTGFKGVDRKRMPACFEEAMQSYRELGFQPAASQSRENLCSRCLSIVPKNTHKCPACSCAFWTPLEVAVRSLAFPSWGDFSLGHTGLAIAELIGYGATWIFFIFLFLNALSEQGPAAAAGIAVFLLLIIGVQHVVDAGLTYFIAKKGLHPKEKIT